MDELKAYLEDGFVEDAQEKTDKDKPASKKKNSATDAKNIELAKMYDNAAEQEKEIELCEKELEIVNATQLKDLVTVLSQELPDEERDYAQELQGILVATWTYRIETEKTHPLEQLTLIKETAFSDVAAKLSEMYPDDNFDTDIRTILVKRLEMLIAITKEHLKEEIDDIYIAGLKPSFVKRIYKQVHGIK